MIEVQGIVKRFGPLEVLKGVSFTVAPSSVTALIGPSGGGKSTLLRCINALEVPEAGEITLGDRTVRFDGSPRREELYALRRKTGMIFQNFQLFPHRSAIQNVMEGLVTVSGWKREEARARAESLLDRVGLRAKAEAYPDTLSGGQQQRVAIARALAQSPEILLCDEPTSALDPELAAEVVAVLRDLAAEGVTMLIATHDLRLAGSVARVLLFLEGGTIADAGPPGELLKNPANPRTRAFVSAVLGEPGDSWVI